MCVTVILLFAFLVYFLLYVSGFRIDLVNLNGISYSNIERERESVFLSRSSLIMYDHAVKTVLSTNISI